MKKINILYMIDYLHEKGGTERHLLYLLKHLDKRIYNCHVLAFDCGATELTDEIKIMGIDLVYIKVGKYYTLDALKKAFKIIKYIKEEKIDIVQTFHFKSDFYGAIVAKIAGVKNIISSKRDTGDFKTEFQFFLSRIIKHITKRYIVVSSAVEKIIIEREKANKDKISVIYNGVDLERYKRPTFSEKLELRKELNFKKEDFIIGTVAWMRPEKNHKILFEAYNSASKKIKNLKIVFVGGGPLLDYYKNFIKLNKLQNNIIAIGPAKDVRKYLSIFDIACLIPSKNEGFSNSILEKMAMGLPLIVSDIGGNAEAVKDGYNGYVIDPYDETKLSNLLLMFYENKKLIEMMGINSIHRVKSKFTIDKMIFEHHKLYISLMLEN